MIPSDQPAYVRWKL